MKFVPTCILGGLLLAAPAYGDDAERTVFLIERLTLDDAATAPLEWEVRDAHGRSLKAHEFAREIEDFDMYRKLKRRWTSNLVTAGFMYGTAVGVIAGGYILYVADNLEVDIWHGSSSWANSPNQRGMVVVAAGSLLTVAAILPTVRALSGRHTRDHFTREEAAGAVDVHNSRLRERLDLPKDYEVRVHPLLTTESIAIGVAIRR